MKLKIHLIIMLISFSSLLYAQSKAEEPDTTGIISLPETVIQSNRLPILLKNNPGATTVVNAVNLSTMPKTIGAEEALRLVPGVRIDNQHDGERIHLSIRGQGILTERGLRGIGVLLDGIPVNDPSGFAPDLYDVDWPTVKQIEVLRGPAASLYGGGGAAGMISITTQDGGPEKLNGEVSQSAGSNGFLKSLVQAGGRDGKTDYRISYSYTKGDGYRDHQAFRGNKLYEKIHFNPVSKLHITQVISHTDYFQQNPEGLNVTQFDNLRQANPDANPFNEYQKTNRTTAGLTGTYIFNNQHDVMVAGYLRNGKYKETSNKYAEYRDITNPGANAQYNFHFITGKLKNTLSAGADMKWQSILVHKFQSASDPNREEGPDETNLETDSLLANQMIIQSSTGLFGLYKMNAGKFNLMASLRYDNMKNELTNKMVGQDTATTTKDFSHSSVRIGGSYEFSSLITLFAGWSQGFLPPSTEELASNPVGYSGFNTHLVPATSGCLELGLRGTIDDIVFYEITGFTMTTENDFFRFKQTGRGNQEVFYGNAGNSKRNGIETYLSWQVMKPLNLQVSYTFSDFKYTSATIDPVYTDTAYVLTTPPADGQWLPNAPQHQLYAELVYQICKSLKVSLATEMQSKWAVYTDAKAYNEEMDPAIYKNWQDGFNLFHARIAYDWNLLGLNGELSLAARNLTGKEYMAFTEPDPDGNSYHPGPGSEFFGNLKIRF